MSSTVFPSEEDGVKTSDEKTSATSPDVAPAGSSVDYSKQEADYATVLVEDSSQQQGGENVVPVTEPVPSAEENKVGFTQGLKQKVEAKFPKDRALRLFFYTSFLFVLAGAVLLVFAIIWISVTVGSSFGAYSVLLFVAGALMIGIALLDVFLLCKNPENVFCHSVLAIVTFFVFLALLILAIILGGFHILTINFEYAAFKMDFTYYQDKLKLDSEKKIEAVDSSYFWLALVLGIVTALIIIGMFVVHTVTCCYYVQCNYFLPFMCGLMPFMVGIFGIVFAVSLASVSAMTRNRFSFIYEPQVFIILICGFADIAVSFILLGGFFCCTCRSERNELQRNATYPQDGYVGNNRRSDVLGFDFWNCKHEFCILLWLNVLVCTPVFVVILVTVVIKGGADHSELLPCYFNGGLVDRRTFTSTTDLLAVSLSTDAFDNSSSMSDSYSLSQSISNCDLYPDDLGCSDLFTIKTYPNTEWQTNFIGECDVFKKSASEYSRGLNHVSDSDYTTLACLSTVTGAEAEASMRESLAAMRKHSSVISRTAKWLGSTLRLSRKSEPTALSSTSSPSQSPFSSSFASLIDTVLAMDPEQLEEYEGDKLRFEYEGEEFESKKTGKDDFTVTHVIRRSEDDFFKNVNSSITSGNKAASPKPLSNEDRCYSYTSIVQKWQKDMESFGAEMCQITGFAMLVPAAPILLLDGVILGIAMVVLMAIYVWLGCLFTYYIWYIIVYVCCQREVVDGVEVHGNVIITYYHIEDNSPGFNCCICCGLSGCCQFICLFSACVLAFCLKDDWCGISCNKADRRSAREPQPEASNSSSSAPGGQQQQQPGPIKEGGYSPPQQQQQQPGPIKEGGYSPPQQQQQQPFPQQQPLPQQFVAPEYSQMNLPQNQPYPQGQPYPQQPIFPEPNGSQDSYNQYNNPPPSQLPYAPAPGPAPGYSQPPDSYVVRSAPQYGAAYPQAYE